MGIRVHAAAPDAQASTMQTVDGTGRDPSTNGSDFTKQCVR